MKILHAVVGVLSIALAFGINAYMAPRVARLQDPLAARTPTGNLSLRLTSGAESREYPLATIRPLVKDLVYPFGKRIEIREVMLRAATDQPEPDVELFLDLASSGVSADTQDPTALLHKSLPVLPTGFGGAPASRIRLVAGGPAVKVIEGAFTLTEVRASAVDPERKTWRVKGNCVLTLLVAEEMQQASGELRGQLVW